MKNVVHRAEIFVELLWSRRSSQWATFHVLLFRPSIFCMLHQLITQKQKGV